MFSEVNDYEIEEIMNRHVASIIKRPFLADCSVYNSSDDDSDGGNGEHCDDENDTTPVDSYGECTHCEQLFPNTEFLIHQIFCSAAPARICPPRPSPIQQHRKWNDLLATTTNNTIDAILGQKEPTETTNNNTMKAASPVRKKRRMTTNAIGAGLCRQMNKRNVEEFFVKRTVDPKRRRLCDLCGGNFDVHGLWMHRKACGSVKKKTTDAGKAIAEHLDREIGRRKRQRGNNNNNRVLTSA